MRTLWIASLALCLCLAAAPLAAAERIGQIKDVRGVVTILRGGGTSSAVIGGDVFSSDVFVTGENSAVGLTLLDKSTYALGPNTRLEMRQFSYRRGGGSRLRLGMDRGELIAKSGDIAKQGPDAMAVELPTSVVGVRGTDLLIVYDPENLLSGEPPQTPPGIGANDPATRETGGNGFEDEDDFGEGEGEES